MVVIRGQELVGVGGRDAVHEDVVDGLDVEGFFDFGVRRDEEVEQDGGGDEGVEGPCWERHGCGDDGWWMGECEERWMGEGRDGGQSRAGWGSASWKCDILEGNVTSMAHMSFSITSQALGEI
jgi:hypothetical protein